MEPVLWRKLAFTEHSAITGTKTTVHQPTERSNAPQYPCRYRAILWSGQRRGVNQSAPRLLASNLWVDDVIKGSNEWGPEQVASRGKALAALAYDKVWKL